MRVAVTGAGGFVGLRLAADLARAGHQVTGTWHRNRARLPASYIDNLAFRQVDLTVPEAVDELFDSAGGFDATIHAAATTATGDEDASYLRNAVRTNVLAQANLVAAASRSGCRRFIFTSSISVYGNRGAADDGYREADAAPASFYGWSKRAAEELLDVAAARHGFAAVSLRLAGVHGIGRGTGALHAIARSALAGSPISVNEPKSRFRWVFIEDVSQAVKGALETHLSDGHHVANLASADVFTLGDLAERIKMTVGSASTVSIARSTRIRSEVMNIDAAARLLGYMPTTLADFLPRYIGSLQRT